MDYKKIIKKSSTRNKILNFLKFVPDKAMIKIQYRIKLGKTLNLKKPERFTEKIQFYKLYYRNPIMKQCVDKFLVRKYVEEKGLKDILNECYGVYDKVDNINFDSFPDKFVLKKTNGGGGLNVLLCNKKDLSYDENSILKDLSSWLKQKELSGGREWAYKGLKPKIIAEKYLENKSELCIGVSDYKFFCYSGVPKYVVVDVNRFIKHKRNFYDMNWKNLEITSDCQQYDNEIEKPKNFDEMIKVAAVLSSDFPFVRVDLYNINGMIIFGELTFYPWSGYVKFFPDESDFILGNDFNVSVK